MLSVPLSTTVDGKVAKSVRGLSTGAFTLLCHVLLTSLCRFDLLLFLVVVLPSRLSARCLLLILLVWFCTWWHVVIDFRQPSRNVSSSVSEIWRSCNYVKLFLGSPCPSLQASEPFSTVYPGYACARSKSTTSRGVEGDCNHCSFRFDDFSQTLFRCVLFVCAHTCLLSSQSTNPPLDRSARLGLSMETLLDPGRSFVQESLCGRMDLHQRWTIWWTNTAEVPMFHNTDHSEYISVTPRTSKQFTSLPWETAKPQDKAFFWERIEAPLPPLRPRPKCNFIHPRQLSPSPERLVLPFSNEVI